MLRRGLSWGRFPPVQQAMVALTDARAPLPDVPGPVLPYGNGRSYGDSCLNPGGTVFDVRTLDRFIAFDPARGTLRCEAGTTLAEILDIVVPQGWFLPVTPGTRYVTVGGAIANDVHGKNHHRAGTFGHHIIDFELLRSDGSRRTCSAGDGSGFFEATLGGLGLTGVILEAGIRLSRIPGPWLETESIRFDDLDDFFALSSTSESTHEYTVAWIDCLARGRSLGRGHFIRADHAACAEDERSPIRNPRWSVPFVPPISVVNRLSLRPFNWLYYHRLRKGQHRRAVHYLPYFYPLDGIRDWNRIYGPRGFLQHQSVIPPIHARDALQEMLREIGRSGLGSFLAVLKEFGTRPSLGMLSFPRLGTTLALDFPNVGQPVFGLLDRLDAIVDAAGGAVYPAKDARMTGASFRRGFPAWQAFAQFVDPQFSSGFWRRVME